MEELKTIWDALQEPYRLALVAYGKKLIADEEQRRRQLEIIRNICAQHLNPAGNEKTAGK